MPSRHIVFATAGSLGDLYPFLALGGELQRRAHRVSIATSANHRDAVLAAGLGFRHMRPDPENTAAFHARFMHPKTGGEFAYRHHLAPAVRDSYADLARATADADLLVSQSLMALAAPLLAARTGIPWISAVFQPMTLFSLHDQPNYLPSPLLRWLCGRSPALHARVFHYVRLHTAQWVKPVLDLRSELGIAGREHPMYEGQHSPRRVLAMFSPLFGSPRPDWPASAVQTGNAVYGESRRERVPALNEFLARGGPPLAVFTLSGSASNDAGDFYREGLAAAGMLGMRALLVASGLAATSPLPDPLPDWALRVDYAPFEDVFPHAAVVVHAGGIGTVFKALQAGVPQVLVPHAHDQLDNALRMARLGAAEVIGGRRTGRRSLARALRSVLRSEGMGRRAAELALAARQEDGVGRACDVIESELAHA
ncbi:glycosyltransferase [Noviherbaspirillum aridicola]|uniref:Rhamnosyltransferase subunit B n=1 Tax=Noviherbaspirillum aridicola TaxID=2849687 RepID=A0ABQ4Q677_9BURK|nr:glycosyltransferase [Noviherbaspirillum aridicola]GIZ52722.1 rhamnosyltransferase subunit B [Noviherbaspirillum aridicola]